MVNFLVLLNNVFGIKLYLFFFIFEFIKVELNYFLLRNINFLVIVLENYSFYIDLFI